MSSSGLSSGLTSALSYISPTLLAVTHCLLSPKHVLLHTETLHLDLDGQQFIEMLSTGIRDVAQLVDRYPSIHKVLGLNPITEQNQVW